MLSNPTLTFGRLLICVFLAAFLLKVLWCKFLFEVDCTPLFVHYFSLVVNILDREKCPLSMCFKKIFKAFRKPGFIETQKSQDVNIKNKIQRTKLNKTEVI